MDTVTKVVIIKDKKQLELLYRLYFVDRPTGIYQKLTLKAMAHNYN